MQPKSERLKKLETELKDLEQWLNLGLVPKKDIDKHQEEIKHLRDKIAEEQDRLHILKESGELEEYITPRRNTKSQYQEADIEIGDEGFTDVGFDLETDSYETTQATSATDAMYTVDEESTQEEEEDPFSDKNRWKRGMLDDQDTSQW